MSAVDNAREAASYALELLRASEEKASSLVAQAAVEYGVAPHVVDAWVMRTFPDSASLELWRAEQRVAAQNRTARLEKLRGVEAAAKDWAMGVWKACEPDGQPLWFYCCDRFLEANSIRDSEHRRAAHRVFADVGQQFIAARKKYLAKMKRL